MHCSKAVAVFVIQRYGYDGFIEMEPCCDGSGQAKMMKNNKLFRVVEKNCWSLEERLKEMDDIGMQK